MFQLPDKQLPDNLFLRPTIFSRATWLRCGGVRELYSDDSNDPEEAPGLSNKRSKIFPRHVLTRMSNLPADVFSFAASRTVDCDSPDGIFDDWIATLRREDQMMLCLVFRFVACMEF